MGGFLDILSAIAALALTLGLFGVAVVLFKRFAPEWMAKMRVVQGGRRLTLVESLVLDPTRRLVLVKLDGAERLILLGEGRVLSGGAPEAGA